MDCRVEPALLDMAACPSADADAGFRSLPVERAGFPAFVEAFSGIVALLDADGTVNYISPAIRATGYEPDELLGRNLFAVLCAVGTEASSAPVMELLCHADAAQRIEQECRTKSGHSKVFEIVARDLTGNPAVRGIVVSMHDVTDRRRMAQLYRESQQRLVDIANTIDQVFWIADPSTSRLLYVSSAYETIWGRSCESLYAEPMSFFEAVHPEDRPRVLAAIGSFSSGMPFDEEYRVVRPNGEVAWIWDRGSLIPDHADGVARYVGVATDITKRRQTEAQLRLFRDLMDQSDDAVEVIDAETLCVIDANQGACKQLGYAREELLGLHVFDFDPQLNESVVRERMAELRQGGGMRFESLHRRKDGSTFPVEIQLRLVELDRSYLLAGVRDITDRKRFELAMEDTIRSLANMVELRDPYTAGHQKRVAGLAVGIARKLGFSQDRMRGLSLAAAIHDVGKIKVPAEILSYPGRLSGPELDLIRTHAQAGYEIVQNVCFPWPIAEMIRQHHERLDGSGYPRRLRGDEILMEARIIAVADVIESIASHRPYRPALGLDVALKVIKRGRGHQFDPQVVDAAIELIR